MLFFAVWATVAPYAGPPLGLVVNTDPVTEVVDHVIPGVVAIACGLLLLRSAGPAVTAALGAALAGFWMSATHLPLVLQAADGEAGLPAVAVLAAVEQRTATRS